MLTDLTNNSALSMSYAELVSHCQQIESSIKVSQEQAHAVVQATKDQARSKLWFRFRSGRITASRMKAVCRTDPTKPSQSLINNIPLAYHFKSTATAWGCSHENLAREMFVDKIAASHVNLKVHDAGFFISPEFPHIGASPDAILSCDCCGTTVLERAT